MILYIISFAAGYITHILFSRNLGDIVLKDDEHVVSMDNFSSN